MMLIADANILFALAKESSTANKIVSGYDIKLISPQFVLKELYKYKKEISSKSKLPFKEVIKSLNKKVLFIDTSEYKEFLKKSNKLIKDPDDVEYIALALKLNLPIWSNDKHFKEQSEVDVLTTKELVNLINEIQKNLSQPL